jgi:hypothetical protein
MSEPTPASSDDPAASDLAAAFDLTVRLLKERRHLAFDELADMLKSHGYPVAGDYCFLYSENACLMAWIGMSRLFWTVAQRLRRHPNVRIQRAPHLRVLQHPSNLRLPIAGNDTDLFMEPHWLPCEFVWRGGVAN